MAELPNKLKTDIPQLCRRLQVRGETGAAFAIQAMHDEIKRLEGVNRSLATAQVETAIDCLDEELKAENAWLREAVVESRKHSHECDSAGSLRYALGRLDAARTPQCKRTDSLAKEK